MFHVGQKVVCIDDAVHQEWAPPYVTFAPNMHGLTEGVVYTVSEMEENPLNNIIDLVLAEIDRGPRRTWADAIGFAACRFRPVATQGNNATQDDKLALFREMCNTPHPIVPGCDTPLELELL
jgi:hypothetical protein